MRHAIEVLAKAGFGGLLVVLFAVFAETLSPKRFAGVFAAAPSVALASLAVTVVAKGPGDAASGCAGMLAGAVGFIVYCLAAPATMRRWGALKGAAAALGGWVAGTACLVPVSVAALHGGTFAAGMAVPRAAGTRASRRPRDRPRLQCEPGKVKEPKAKDWLIRFGFGALTSAAAGGISLVAGPVIGGTFLAFPAILLASLTLVAEEEGRAKARDDARGGTFGALGLVAFAVGGALLFGHLPSVAVFPVVAAAWAITALSAYAVGWALGVGGDEPA